MGIDGRSNLGLDLAPVPKSHDFSRKKLDFLGKKRFLKKKTRFMKT
jgi:hypothetical protein